MDKKEIHQDALTKFQEKYHVNYEEKYVEKIRDGSRTVDEIHITVPDYMDTDETAIISCWIDPKEGPSVDNLFGYIIRKDYEKKALDIVRERYPEAKLYSRFFSLSFSDSLTTDSTLEDAYAAGEKMISNIQCVILTNDNQDKFIDSSDRINQKWKENGIHAVGVFYAVTDEKEFETIVRANLYEQIDLFAKDSVCHMNFDAYETRSF